MQWPKWYPWRHGDLISSAYLLPVQQCASFHVMKIVLHKTVTRIIIHILIIFVILPFFKYTGKIAACEFHVNRVSREYHVQYLREFHMNFTWNLFHVNFTWNCHVNFMWNSFHVKFMWNISRELQVNRVSHEIHVKFTCGDFACVMQRKLQYPAVFDRYDVCYDWRITGQPGEYLELFLIRTVQYDQPCTMGRSCFYVFDGNLWRHIYGNSSFQKIYSNY